MSEFAIPQNHAIPLNHLATVCRWKQSGCCRYIVYFERPSDFYCVKKIPELKAKMDEMVETMNSKGDNCQGMPHEKGS